METYKQSKRNGEHGRKSKYGKIESKVMKEKAMDEENSVHRRRMMNGKYEVHEKTISERRILECKE